MAVVAYVGAVHLPSAYYLFFFGVVELSSIPLAIVDFFHPQKGLPQLLEKSTFLKTLNEMSRIVFAVLFMIVRAVYFPYVVIILLLPDVVATWTNNPPDMQKSLAVVVASSVGLTLLQLYWAVLIGKQVMKLLNRNGSDEKKSK